MKTWIAALSLSAPALLPHTQDAKALTAQQNLMKTCNADAKGIKSNERKAFMKSRLAGATPVPQATDAQQGEMKTCNAEVATRSLKGDERKQFMSACSKG